jgi:hypothetical protein
MPPETEKTEGTKKMPKGGRKGGALFPRTNLAKALSYSKKLVSKTHTGPQAESTILPGVFGNAGSPGKIRASALKQFGLLEGPPTAYKASALAKEIDASTDGERYSLIQQAFLKCKPFKQIFETFQGDDVSKAKIEQRVKGLGVHPDSANECAQIFLDSIVAARLGTINGDTITLASTGNLNLSPEVEQQQDGTAMETEYAEEANNLENEESESLDPQNDTKPGSKRIAKSGVTLNFTVDPSSDPDKLEKQLKLLRRYGLL